MIQSLHCDLCEYPKRDLHKGLTCGLTNKKPDFKEACPDILLGDKFQSKLENAILDLDRILKSKKKAYLTFYILIVIGFLVIVGSKLYADLTNTTVFYWKFRASAIGFGVLILIGAYFKFNKFRDRLKKAEFEKDKIDSVLKKYGIDYRTTIDYKEEIHGSQDIVITIDYDNWTKKRTTTTHNSQPG